MARKRKKFKARPIQNERTSGRIPRLALVDLLRGVALIGMTVFHFVYDLEFFGYREKGYSDALHWWGLAIIVAGSFLYLSGVSLYLAHVRSFQWKAWGRRVTIIALAATAITITTFLITPDQYIRFGILHMITAASIFGLAFLRVPWWLTAIAAVLIFMLDRIDSVPMFDTLALLWLGFFSEATNASDFRPVIPWLAPALLGIATARMCHQFHWLDTLASLRLDHQWGRIVRFLGRHSLLYYLLHQPVLFALFWIWPMLSLWLTQ